MLSSGLVSSTVWSAATLTYAIVALCVILLVQTLVKPYISGNIPPFPAMPYPILGHLPYVMNGRRKRLWELRKQAGDIFSVYFGSQLFVVVNGPRLVKEILFCDRMSSRPPQPFVEQGDYGIVFANGHMWKEQRSVSMAILRSFGMGKSCLADKISEEVTVYLDTLSALGGNPSDVHTLTGMSTCNVICSIIVGKRFDYDDPLFKSFVENSSRQIVAFDNMSPVVVWPWLRYIPGNFLGAKTMNDCSQVIRRDFCDKFIEMALKSDSGDAPPTFITSYLEEMDKVQRQGKDTTLSRDQLRVILQQLFIGGTDTAATTVMWFLVYMLKHPDIQIKMYEEISRITGPRKAPEMQDRVKLPYTCAVIMETQRLASIAPHSVPHYCTGDTVIEGYRIPEGAIVLPSLDSVMMDEDTWEEPLKFWPERFINQAGSVFKPDQFIPFGLGPRRCIGEALANMELFLYITSLVKRFELQPSTPGQPPTGEYVEGLVCNPSAFKLRFIERETL